jgi:hypothetical protein
MQLVNKLLSNPYRLHVERAVVHGAYAHLLIALAQAQSPLTAAMLAQRTGQTLKGATAYLTHLRDLDLITL